MFKVVPFTLKGGVGLPVCLTVLFFLDSSLWFLLHLPFRQKQCFIKFIFTLRDPFNEYNWFLFYDIEWMLPYFFFRLRGGGAAMILNRQIQLYKPISSLKIYFIKVIIVLNSWKFFTLDDNFSSLCFLEKSSTITSLKNIYITLYYLSYVETSINKYLVHV